MKPPKLRFKSPQPYIAGEAVWDVSGQSDIMCPQIDNYGVLSGEEDCLMINIYVPEVAFESALPVMAWIHGGALIRGSNQIQVQGPQGFMDRNVVVVTINYRSIFFRECDYNFSHCNQFYSVKKLLLICKSCFPR